MNIILTGNNLRSLTVTNKIRQLSEALTHPECRHSKAKLPNYVNILKGYNLFNKSHVRT